MSDPKVVHEWTIDSTLDVQMIENQRGEHYWKLRKDGGDWYHGDPGSGEIKAELARLAGELERLRQVQSRDESWKNLLRAQRDKLKAENDRLREALEPFAARGEMELELMEDHELHTEYADEIGKWVANARRAMGG